MKQPSTTNDKKNATRSSWAGRGGGGGHQRSLNKVGSVLSAEVIKHYTYGLVYYAKCMPTKSAFDYRMATDKEELFLLL
jgi:hypothetical protein